VRAALIPLDFSSETQINSFADFAKFADVLNHWLAGDEDEPRRNPWRVQELPDPELRILGPHDAPTGACRAPSLPAGPAVASFDCHNQSERHQ
jgi:hypothetical protein